ncbi:hypothetical protein V8C86DRAFT_2518951 [Haematococcus lacustris]
MWASRLVCAFSLAASSAFSCISRSAVASTAASCCCRCRAAASAALACSLEALKACSTSGLCSSRLLPRPVSGQGLGLGKEVGAGGGAPPLLPGAWELTTAWACPVAAVECGDTGPAQLWPAW